MCWVMPPASPAPVLWALAVLALAPASELVPDLVHRVPAAQEALALPAEHRLRAKRRARRVLQAHRAVVAVNSIPRPKKAR